MEFKYQIIFLGSVDERVDQLTDLLFAQIRELKLLEEAYKIILEGDFNEYSGNQPAYVVYFGDDEGHFKNLDKIEHLKKDGVAILPVFSNSFSKEIPGTLKNQNGLLYSPKEHEKIVSLILESFGKLRSTRKVFVSYRRDESSSVAIQLYEALERKNFDVFLDTHSIKQGEPFQEELWHRMADCDVVVLLNTSKFLESKWCKEEIAEASTKRIGVVQLVWPGHKPENFADISFPVQMEPSNFVNWVHSNPSMARLRADFVDELVSLVESVRARNLASRQDNIITEFLNVGRKKGRNLVLQYERVITEELEDGTKNIYVPAVGIPQSLDCEQSEKIRKELENSENALVYIIYDDLRIRNNWLDHLKWLNRQLEVKTIGTNDFEKWLTK
jgi:hypothetical protein